MILDCQHTPRLKNQASQQMEGALEPGEQMNVKDGELKRTDLLLYNRHEGQYEEYVFLG